MQSLTSDYKTRYPGVVIGGIGDEAHKLRTSDHNEDDTAGSRSAQSDPDSIPEHRAIDVMLGPVFNRVQALATIHEVLADPKNRARLRYINFENTQWHVGNNFEPLPSGDPHPTHIHYSQLAAADADARPWLKETDMFEQDDRNTATADTWRLLTLLTNGNSADYQLTGEATARSEPNLLKAQLDRVEAALAALAAPVPGITEARLREIIREEIAKTRLS
jgi:hypothetical protein